MQKSKELYFPIAALFFEKIISMSGEETENTKAELLTTWRILFSVSYTVQSCGKTEQNLLNEYHIKFPTEKWKKGLCC